MVQGTVSAFVAAERSGRVLLDDGTELAFGEAAFDASGLRLLRPGQRVRFTIDGSGRVAVVQLLTLP